MKREPLMKTMREAISKVLETMFFLPVQIANSDFTLREWFPQDQSLLGATLNFTGPSAGSMYLFVPVEMADKMTANFLGFGEEKINEEQKMDTVKEALNMIGGSMLSILDRKGAITLGIPELIEEIDLTDKRLGDLKGELILVKTEDNQLAVVIEVE